ncbi:uncharacterized protein [Montipora capricornis]|uniref:uncharacterized protein n=1 Tax=Montipora capricornis TaxID=246305 RepID=UPI0035F21B39
MAAGDEDFILGDDFDAIMAALEDNKEFEVHFEEAVEEVQRQGIACSLCQKICKSKRGLNRHIAVKHKECSQDNQQETHNHSCESTLTADILIGIVNDTKIRITGREVFANTLREEIKSYQFNINEESTEFAEIQRLYHGFIKKGNAEKFYAKYYSEIALNSTKYFEGLSRNAATLLSTKLADRLLTHSKESLLPNSSNYSDVQRSFSDKEVAGLQYLGGYVLQNLHKKHRTSRNCKSSESQQAMSLLSACKEDDQNARNSQRLIASLNRGGLWSPTESAQKIFVKTEHYFKSYSSQPDQFQKIDIKNIIQKSAQDPDVVSSYNAIVSESGLRIDSSVSKDILHCIIHLYVRVRSFSLAKDIIQKYKIQQKQVKAKALRKEIQRANEENTEGRQP